MKIRLAGTPRHGLRLLRIIIGLFLCSATSFASESTDVTKSDAYSFRNHVLPILTKQGCNSGSCHGTLAGKGGFRLSLRGYDPESDYFNIVKQDRGRRVVLSDPGRSLVLAKPSGAIPHKGGLRFETDSLEYQIIADWIANGAAPPSEEDALVERISISPDRATHALGDSRQMSVMSHFSDGNTSDVSRWVRWSSTNEAVATIDDEGAVTVIGPGEGAIVASYASQLAIARITVPYASGEQRAKSGELVDSREPRNFIDEQIDKQLERLNLPASAPCSDADFVRRAYVDTIGALPTIEEVRTFLGDASEDKRDRLIEELLARPEFVDYWTYKWSDVLMLNGNLLRPKALKTYYDWIHERVEQNTPWDEFVHEILTSTGSSYENGATNFFAVNQDPEGMTENACQAFLGLSIGCAKCHNHPLEKWTNDQYYAMANMFARVRAKGWGGDGRSGDGLRTLYVVETGELVQPRTGRPQPPTPLDAEPVPFDDPTDRRETLADWMTSPDNPYFARSITNRVWANFFGVGLIEQVDDMRASNPASNEELLASAASYLVEQQFNLKTLMRMILQSNAYQRSSLPLPGNREEHRFYSRYYPRRMMAEVLLDGVVQVTGVPSEFNKIAYAGSDRVDTDFYPEGTKAIQLFESTVENYFLQTFGRNQRRITCECERSDVPSMVQVLHLSNGDTINEKLKAEGSRVGQLVQLRHSGMSDAALLDDIYLACLARYPTGLERQSLLPMLPAPETGDERVVVEDIFWAILSSREFLFNH